MANNNNLFNAALSGAAAGIASRVLQSSVSADYDAQAALIQVFATAFDAEIAPIVGGGSRGQADVVSEISAAFWRDRIIPAGTSFDTAAANLAALYNALSPLLEADSGGGGSSAPLTTVLVGDVGATGTPTGAFSGTDGAYPSLDDAVVAAAEGDTIWIAPGNYTATPIAALGVPITLYGQGYGNQRPSIIVETWGVESFYAFVNLVAELQGDLGSTLDIDNSDVNFTGDNGTTFTARNSRIAGNCGEFVATDCSIETLTESTPPSTNWVLNRCSVVGSLTLNTAPEAIIQARDTVFEAIGLTITTRLLQLDNCDVTRGITCESIIAQNSSFIFDTVFEIARDFGSSFENCNFDSNGGTITLSGAVGVADIRFDSYSWMSFAQNGWTITGARGTEYNLIITDFTAQAQGNSAVPIPDDGVLTPILVLPTFNLLSVAQAIIFIAADNGTDTADGTLVLESDTGETFTVTWGPLAVGQTLAVPITNFANDPTDAPTAWTLSATVTIGTGDCTVAMASLVLNPLQ